MSYCRQRARPKRPPHRKMIGYGGHLITWPATRAGKVARMMKHPLPTKPCLPRTLAAAILMTVWPLTNAAVEPSAATDTARLGTAATQTSTDSIPTMGHADGLLFDQLRPRNGRTLTVTSPAFNDGADIPFENTQYRGNIFPGLRWTPGPAATRSYVVVMQGESLKGTLTSIHLSLYNISAAVTHLEAGMTAPPPGA
jgi:hypothetical protein